MALHGHTTAQRKVIRKRKKLHKGTTAHTHGKGQGVGSRKKRGQAIAGGAKSNISKKGGTFGRAVSSTASRSLHGGTRR